MVKGMIFVALGMILSSAAFGGLNKALHGNSEISGGLAGSGFSLRGAKLSQLGQAERLQLEIGTIRGEALKGYPGYFHVEMQKRPNRLVIDLSQTPKTFIDPARLEASLRASRFIAKSNLLVDPMDHSMSLILDLKKEATAKVYQVKGQKGTSQIVVDIQ